MDSHIVPGSSVPPFYDSLMGKIIASGPDRAAALARLRGAIAGTSISGVKSNLDFHGAALDDPEFKAGGVDTGFVDRLYARRPDLGGQLEAKARMAEVQLVETSLRDGNQCLWAALGIDTARTLAIAEVMDRVGFRAIDFTTSTHMGVAVRYKKEDPWERIRLMAAATPNTPLQFMSTGFRFISWETASPEFMALAFRTLARNGIRRFCLADPMNDAESNMACARMVKEGGGEYVIVALVFTLSPIHDDAHYIERARKLAACPSVDALYIKDPGGLLKASRAQTLIPAIKAVMGGKPLELHSHCTIGLAEHTYMDAPDLGVAALQCASGAAADGTSNPHSERVVANLRALGHRVAVDDEALGRVNRYFTRLAEAEGLPAGTAAALRCALPAASAAGRHGRHHAPPARRGPTVASRGSGDRGAGTGPRGAWLAHRHDAFRANPHDLGRDECDEQGALQGHPGRGDPLRDRSIRPPDDADRCSRDGAHRIASAHPRVARRA